MAKSASDSSVYRDHKFINPVSEDFEKPEQFLDVGTFDNDDHPTKSFETSPRAARSQTRRPSITMESFESAAAEVEADSTQNVEATDSFESAAAETASPENAENAESFGERLYAFLEEPSSSTPAAVFGVLLLALILVSCACFVVETLEYVRSRPALLHKMEILEVAAICVFTVEYIVRVSCCNARPSPNAEGVSGVLRYMAKPINLVDVLAVAPFWIERAWGGDGKTAVIRLLRMTRVFRIFKASTHASELSLFSAGMDRAQDGLILLSFLLMLYLCVFGTLLYMAENESQQMCTLPEVAQFDYAGSSCPAQPGFTSIPTTWYYILATLTTVGYGDMYPVTVTGRLISCVCMLFSIVVLGLPMVVVMHSFDDAFKDAKWHFAQKQLKADTKRHQKFMKRNSRTPNARRGRLGWGGGASDSPTKYLNLDSLDPSIDVLTTIRSMMRTLDDLYFATGDGRFYSARRALTRGLDVHVHKDFLQYASVHAERSFEKQ